jgi:hypothetical protein
VYVERMDIAVFNVDFGCVVEEEQGTGKRRWLR